jgi:hypothetical protein
MVEKTVYRKRTSSEKQKGIPAWAQEDWDETVHKLSQDGERLPADVKRAQSVLTGASDRGTIIGLEDVWTATAPVLFNPSRLAEFLDSLNPRILKLWARAGISLEQVQFYVLRLLKEASARVSGGNVGWLPPIPETAS